MKLLRVYGSWFDRKARGNWGIVWFGAGAALWTQMLQGRWPF